MRGKQVLMESLVAHGVEYVFGNPGTTESPILDALLDHPQLTYVVALHEGFRLLRVQRRELIEGSTSEGSGRPPLAERIVDPRSPGLALEAKQALETLASLKRRQRDTLALRVSGYSYREIQAIRGVTYTNVNRHVSEGRAAARRLRDAA